MESAFSPSCISIAGEKEIEKTPQHLTPLRAGSKAAA
jgi:hypothetical protein